MMGKIIKIFAIIYLLISVYAAYAILQTSANYTMVIETGVKFRISYENVTIENRSTNPLVIVTIWTQNPSKLDVIIKYTDYTIYLFNKSKTEKNHEAISVYSSYSATVIKAGKSVLLKYKQDSPNQKNNINYILDRDLNAQIDYNFRIIYKIVEFPDWDERTLQLITYQETSPY